MIRRVGLYSPYLDIWGGGERYLFSIAQHYVKIASVDIYYNSLPCSPSEFITRVYSHFGINITLVSLIEFSLLRSSKMYDLFICIINRKVPFSNPGKIGLIMLQLPPNEFNKQDLATWDGVICNSNFVKNALQNQWNVDAQVLYPPVDTIAFVPGNKQKLLLTVGRFNTGRNCKNHHIAIQNFKQLYRQRDMSDWQFTIAGAVSNKEGEEYLIAGLRMNELK